MPTLSTEYLIPIPDEKGIVVKTAGTNKSKYVYKQTSYYRNEEGKPRNESILIGKFDKNTGKMSPNKNYFSLYGVAPFLKEGQVLSHGFLYLANHIATATGLRKCLVKAIGEHRAKELLAVAAFIAQEGNVMDDIDDWQSRNYLPGLDACLTSQSTSKMFAGIRPEERSRFFKEWIGHSHTGGAVCYDVTSISSYSVGQVAIEFGYNRDHDQLRQFNLGSFCDEGSKLPLYYSCYNGSLTDKTNLAFILKDARKKGLSKVKMVLDGGFWEAKCFKGLADSCEAFTVGMPASGKAAREIIEEHHFGSTDISLKIDTPHFFCKRIPCVQLGIRGEALLYLNTREQSELIQELCEKIDRTESALKKHRKYPASKLKIYEQYFNLHKNNVGTGFTYERNHKKINKLLKEKGFFLIFTTDEKSTADETLFYYRSKDVAEKLFEQIKDYMDGDRLRTHNEETAEGKIFATFLATVIRTYLTVKLSPYLKEYSTSVKHAIKQLSNITVTYSCDEVYLTKALTKKQKALLELFEITQETMMGDL